jgi:hypothetical protein
LRELAIHLLMLHERRSRAMAEQIVDKALEPTRSQLRRLAMQKTVTGVF